MSSSNKIYLATLIIGIILILGGLLLKNKNTGSPNIQVLDTPSSSGIGSSVSPKITVDISGAVQNPGVYTLNTESRVEDLLVTSGGLSENADRNWIDKNLNRAAKLNDGQKIYIPQIQQSNVLGASVSSTSSNVAQSYSTSDSNLININTASLNDIETLPGIGQTYGQKIIDNRPYSDVSELLSKKVLKDSLYNKIKDKLTVY